MGKIYNTPSDPISEALELPDYGNPLARLLGERLTWLQQRRGLTDKEMAEQLGMSIGSLLVYLRGQVVPTNAVCERMAKWAFEGVNYAKEGLPRRQNLVERGEGWHEHKWNACAETHKRLIQTCTRMRISISMFTQIAVERLLDHEPVLAQYAACEESLKRARVAAMLNADKYLGVFLDGDLDIAARLEARTSPRELDKSKIAIENLLDKLANEAKEEANETV